MQPLSDLAAQSRRNSLNTFISHPLVNTPDPRNDPFFLNLSIWLHTIRQRIFDLEHHINRIRFAPSHTPRPKPAPQPKPTPARNLSPSTLLDML